MQLKSVKEEWNNFQDKVFGNAPVSDLQRQEMQQAFYAGFSCCLGMNKSIGEPSVSEEYALQHLDACSEEIITFFQAIIRQSRERN